MISKFPEKAQDCNLYFDSEWIAITKEFNEYIPLEKKVYNFSNFFPNVRL
jgi:hypothetical protein